MNDTIKQLLDSRTDKLPVELPEYNRSVLAILKHYSTNRQVYRVLMAVDEDDHSWVTADDKSEIAFSWDVISWIYLPELEAGKEERDDT
jgi:hypothetical protein